MEQQLCAPDTQAVLLGVLYECTAGPEVQLPSGKHLTISQYHTNAHSELCDGQCKALRKANKLVRHS